MGPEEGGYGSLPPETIEASLYHSRVTSTIYVFVFASKNRGAGSDNKTSF